MASGSSWKLNIAAVGRSDNFIRWCAHLVTDPGGEFWLLEYDDGVEHQLFLGLADMHHYVHSIIFLEVVGDTHFPHGYPVDDYSPW